MVFPKSDQLVGLPIAEIKTKAKLHLKAVPSLFTRNPVPKPDTHNLLRFNLIWFFFIVVVFVPMPLWMFAVDCYAGRNRWVLVCVTNAWTALFLLLALIRASYSMWRVRRAANFPNYRQFYPKSEKSAKIKHLVVMSCYKEPLALIMSTLDTVKAQTEAKSLFVVVGLEEGTPDRDDKEAELVKTYDIGCFFGFMISVHAKGVPGEIPGKCSNSNYATREGVVALWRRGDYDSALTTVTTLDADNLFPPRYFEFLGYDFFRRADRHGVIWQAPLYYNLQLDRRPFFVRVTGILRAFFMTGVLIPQNINTMSVFSMSVQMVEKSQFFHPGYQMDDIIYLLTAMISLGKRVRIFMIPYPIVSGPTSGDSLGEELTEWGRQARRWTVGAAEVFHYFCVKFRSFDLRSGIIYGIHFTHYYGLVLCGMSLVNLNGLIASVAFHGASVCTAAEYLPDPRLVFLPVVGIAVPYAVFAGMFVLDRIGIRYAGVEEHVGWARNALHWVSTPLVLLAYSGVEMYALTKLALFGKDVCTHDPSSKDSLALGSDISQA